MYDLHYIIYRELRDIVLGLIAGQAPQTFRAEKLSRLLFYILNLLPVQQQCLIIAPTPRLTSSIPARTHKHDDRECEHAGTNPKYDYLNEVHLILRSITTTTTAVLIVPLVQKCCPRICWAEACSHKCAQRARPNVEYCGVGRVGIMHWESACHGKESEL